MFGAGEVEILVKRASIKKRKCFREKERERATLRVSEIQGKQPLKGVPRNRFP